MNSSNQERGLFQVSNIVTSTIKSVNNSICDWQTIKRAPLILKQKVQSGNSSTVDEEFDSLNHHLQLIKLKLNMLNKNCQIFSSTTFLLLLSIENIIHELKKLVDIDNDHDDHNDDNNNDENINKDINNLKHKLSICNSVYQKTVYYIKDSVDEPLKLFNIGFESKFNQILSIIAIIETKIETRLKALIKYDNSYNKHELLYLQQKSGQILSTKKCQKLMYLERKLDEYKSNYQEINQLLKKELVVFFKLFHEFINQIKWQTYFIHLMIIYQFQSLVESFAISIGLSTDLTLSHIQDNFVNFQNLINNLSIINVRDNDLKYLVEFNSNYPQCKALFDFYAQMPGDLSIRKNDLINILEKNGLWWKGELNNRIGYFPSNYVEELKN